MIFNLPDASSALLGRLASPTSAFSLSTFRFLVRISPSTCFQVSRIGRVMRRAFPLREGDPFAFWRGSDSDLKLHFLWLDGGATNQNHPSHGSQAPNHPLQARLAFRELGGGEDLGFGRFGLGESDMWLWVKTNGTPSAFNTMFQELVCMHFEHCKASLVCTKHRTALDRVAGGNTVPTFETLIRLETAASGGSSPAPLKLNGVR